MRVEPDRDNRRALLFDVQRIVADELPYINLWYVDNVCVYRDRLQIETLSPTGDYGFLQTMGFSSK